MSRKMKKKTSTPMDVVGSIIFFLIGLLVFLPMSPVIGIAVCVATGKNMLNTLKQLDLTGTEDFGRVPAKVGKTTGQDAAQRFLSRMRADDKKERVHSHTPRAYSYDTCAREKRLEQLKVLKDAGLLDEVEYRQRREQIQKMR